jgi:putative methionine-R-sulfoxide reductase with GAF domain
LLKSQTAGAGAVRFRSLWFALVVLLAVFILASVVVLWLIQKDTDPAKRNQSLWQAELFCLAAVIGIGYSIIYLMWKLEVAEESLRQLNREMRAISKCSRSIVRAEDEPMLLRDICNAICDEAGYRMAWVGYAEDDDAKTVRPVAWAGSEDGYLAKANITWADNEGGRGPTGAAIRSGESVYTRDFMTDRDVAAWRENALQRGYRSSIAVPLKDVRARTFGALTIYSAEPNAFTAQEMRLIEELAADVAAFGVTRLRERAGREPGTPTASHDSDHGARIPEARSTTAQARF